MRICSMVLALGLVWTVQAPLEAAKQRETLADIESERKLEKRARKALKFARRLVDEVAKAYFEDNPEQGEALLSTIQDAVELARESLYDTGKDPFKKPKHFKKAEIATRDLVRDLNEVEKRLRFSEREYLQSVRDRVSEINQELLMAIMTKNDK